MSQLFRPYVQLGVVTNHLPFCYSRRDREKEAFITTCTGKSLLVFRRKPDGKLVRVSNGVEMIHDRNVRAFTVIPSNYRFATCAGQSVFVWGKKGLKYQLEGHTEKVSLLCSFANILVSIGKDNLTNVWNASELVNTIRLGDAATAVVHPPTYVNKILVGLESGQLVLLNVKSGKTIYTFKGWGSPVTCLEASPAADVIGIGLKDGSLILHNVRLDRTIMRFSQASLGGAVTSISFRTTTTTAASSAGHGPPSMMVSGSPSGCFAVWNLDERTLVCKRNAHRRRISRVFFAPDEPILISSGTDNCLKMWIFDKADGKPRLLREVSGHADPPRFAMYVGSRVYSAGLDRTLRWFSAHTFGHVTQPLKRQSPTIGQFIMFDYNGAKGGQYDALVSVHQGESGARTWNLNVMGLNSKRMLSPSSMSTTTTTGSHAHHGAQTPLVKCVALSTCANFALVGTGDGRVCKFNVQSGIERLSWQAHRGAVSGLCTDRLNKHVLSVGLDGCICKWELVSGKLVSKYPDDDDDDDDDDDGASIDGMHPLMAYPPISKLVVHKDSSLIAIVQDSQGSVSIFDVDASPIRRVRHFPSVSNDRITDISFSKDARWLVVSSMDSTIRVFDLPSARMVDWFTLPSPATSVCFSPTGAFLATCHVGELGIFVWSNRSHFNRVFLRPVGSDPSSMDLPRSAGTVGTVGTVGTDGTDGTDGTGGTAGLDSGGMVEDDVMNDERVEDDGLVTLSIVPSHVWKSLPHWEVIKERNAPRTRPDTSVDVPFFIPTTTSSARSESFDVSDDAVGSSIASSHMLSSAAGFEATNTLSALLHHKKYAQVVERCASLTPSSLDFELRTLGGDHSVELSMMLVCLDDQLRNGAHFGFVHSLVSLFVKIHSNALLENKELAPYLEQLMEAHDHAWERLSSLLRYNEWVYEFLQK